ncbi:MAG: hypothetical protein KGJ81_17755 [Alphaproteobacteria bacterium]|nr:hypothetical protein [Alphaproteobacteria bacterium]
MRQKFHALLERWATARSAVSRRIRASRNNLARPSGATTEAHPPEQRTPTLLGVGAGAFLVVVLIVVLAGGAIAYGFVQQDTELGEELHSLARYRAEAGLRPGLQNQIKTARQQLASIPGQIAGTSAPLAQAALQNAVKTIVDQNGGEIRSAQIVPATRANGFETIAVQYDLVVPVTHLSAMAYAIESSTPYLFIDDADITMPQNWQPEPPQAPEPEVEVRWTIHGYRWVGAP